MPDPQEVFRMATQKVRPELGALERQLGRQRRRSTQRKVGALIAVAALVVSGAVIVFLVAGDRGKGGGTTPAHTGRGLGEMVVSVPEFGCGFSSDGTRLFAGPGRNTSGFIYDAETGDRLQTVSGRGEGVVAFSPDGRRFVTSQGGDTQELWTYVYDTATGEELWRTRKACCFAAFSPDGRFLAIPRAGITSVVDLETGEIVNEYALWGAMAFSPDGERLLVSPGPELAEQGVVGYVFEVHGGGSAPVLSLRADSGDGNVPEVFVDWDPWSADGSMVSVPTSTGAVFVWSARTGAQMFEIPPGAGKFVSTAFGPDDRLATGSTDGTAVVWSLAETPERVVTLRGHRGTVWHVVFSPDGTRLMTATGGGPTKVWDVSP